MRDTRPSSASVVVGIDGSRNAVTAALWAVPEAVERDFPLRLVYAIEPATPPADPHDAARDLATAEIAVRHAFTAVESTGAPVKIEVEILQGRPIQKLLEASRSAAMVCVGALGHRRATARVGSTAAALANSARCPVAIIRGDDAFPAQTRSVLAEVDHSPDSDAVLERGIDEALLRGAPLTVVSVWQPHVTDIHDTRAVSEQSRRLRAELDRRLARSTHRHPTLEVHPVAVHGNLLDYLSHHVGSIQLVVVGRRRARGVAEMTGPAGHAALHGTDCSVLICDPHNSL